MRSISDTASFAPRRAMRSMRAASARRIARPLIIAAMALTGAMAPFFPTGMAMAKTVYVPITFRQDSGTRPFIPVQMNGKTFLMMVHANADFYMMTTHENAASIGIDKDGTQDSYGISSPGHLSNLGRSETILPELHVGSVITKNTPLSLFSIPQDPPTDGMMGVRWLREQKVIVDYDRARVGLPEAAADSAREDAALITRGYIPHKMSWDDTRNAYFVMAEINGRHRRLSVSTVADNLVDLRFAREADIQLGPVIDEEFGPRGSHIPSYNVRTPIILTLDGQRVPLIRPQSLDASAYQSGSNPHYLDAATLGADFMLDNQAVIDFGTGTMFLRKSAP